MKIETYGAPKVENRARSAPLPGELPSGGYGELARGISSIGEGVQAGVDKYKEADQQQEKAKYEADVVAARDAVTELERKKIERLYGQQKAGPANSGSSIVDGGDQGAVPADPFLETRGMTAAEQRAGVLQGFDQDKRAIWTGLKNDQQRALYQREADRVSNSMLGTVEQHTSAQVQQAKFDSVKAAESSAVRQAALDPNNDDAAHDLVAGVVGPARGLATSPQAADEAGIAVQANVTKARLDQLLNGNNDWQSAERVLNMNRAALGAQADGYDKAIALSKEKTGGEALAGGIIAGARKPNGFLDEAKAVAAFEALPAAQRSQSAKAALDHSLTLEKARETSVKSDAFDNALSAYLGRHNINDVPPTTKVWMQANDPKAWHQLEQVVHSDREAARGAPPTDAQRQAMTAFEVDLHDHLDKYATMPLKEFNATIWPTLSKNDRERAGALFAAAHGQAAKPGAITPQENDMLLQKGRDAGLFPPKGKDPAQWEGDSADLYYKASETLQAQATAYRKANGKPPPFEQMKQWAEDLVIAGKIPNSGYLWDTKTTRLEALTKDTAFEPKWTDEQKSEVVKGMHARGITPTDDKIDTVLRAAHGLPTRPVQQPPAPSKPPSTQAEADAADNWGVDVSEPTIDYGD